LRTRRGTRGCRERRAPSSATPRPGARCRSPGRPSRSAPRRRPRAPIRTRPSSPAARRTCRRTSWRDGRRPASATTRRSSSSYPFRPIGPIYVWGAEIGTGARHGGAAAADARAASPGGMKGEDGGESDERGADKRSRSGGDVRSDFFQMEWMSGERVAAGCAAEGDRGTCVVPQHTLRPRAAPLCGMWARSVCNPVSPWLCQRGAQAVTSRRANTSPEAMTAAAT
jgi:hypothetical protein